MVPPTPPPHLPWLPLSAVPCLDNCPPSQASTPASLQVLEAPSQQEVQLQHQLDLVAQLQAVTEAYEQLQAQVAASAATASSTLALTTTTTLAAAERHQVGEGAFAHSLTRVHGSRLNGRPTVHSVHLRHLPSLTTACPCCSYRPLPAPTAA